MRRIDPRVRAAFEHWCKEVSVFLALRAPSRCRLLENPIVPQPDNMRVISQQTSRKIRTGNAAAEEKWSQVRKQVRERTHTGGRPDKVVKSVRRRDQNRGQRVFGNAGRKRKRHENGVSGFDLLGRAHCRQRYLQRRNAYVS